MCGITCIFGQVTNPLGSLVHRGPDDTRCVTNGKCTMIFDRLAINDMSDNGMQPFESGNESLICNGEIFNHKELSLKSHSRSDCACLSFL